MSFLLTKAFWSRREKTDKCKSANGVFNPNCRSHTFTSDSKSPFNNNQLNKDNMTANSAGQGLGSIYGVQNGPNTGAASNSFSNSAGNLGLQPQHSPISPVQTPVRDNQSQSLTATHTRRKSCINYLESSSEDLSEQGSTSTCLGDTDRRINVRTLSLIVCTVSYLMFGAAIFDFIESENEEEQRAELIEREKNISERYNISQDDRVELEEIYVRLVPFKSGIQWKFTGAFYFVLTVITTIGYGHAAPATRVGKVFCMAYAFIGIPLSLTVYQAVGERLNTFTAWWLMHAKSRFFKRPKTEVQVTQTELVMAGWSACSLVLFGGAAVFSHYEQWRYFDSLYYCYITLTTIGFGDYIALQNDNALQKDPKYVFFSILYIMVALCVVASSINLLVLKFLTMNTMDEKENAQNEARKQFSNVLRQVAHERSRPASVCQIDAEPSSNHVNSPTRQNPRFTRTSAEYSNWDHHATPSSLENSTNSYHHTGGMKRLYTKNSGKSFHHMAKRPSLVANSIYRQDDYNV